MFKCLTNLLWNKLPFGDNPFDWLTDWLRKAWFIYCESNHSKWTRQAEHLFVCMALLLLCSCVCVFKAWSFFPLWLCCIVQLVGRWFRGKGGWIHSWLHQLWPGPDVEQDLLERQAYSLRQTVIGLLLNPQPRFQQTHSMWDAFKASHVERDPSSAFHHVFLNCTKCLKHTGHK